MKIKDIKFDPPNHQFAEDVLQDAKTNPDDEIECIRCQTKYKRGVWNFYSLCNACFAKFDSQKMEGRFFFFNPANKDKKRPTFFESAREWAKNNPK